MLNGQLVEGAPPEDAVHLSNLDEDMGERVNLKDRHPDVTAQLKSAAESWRGSTGVSPSRSPSRSPTRVRPS